MAKRYLIEKLSLKKQFIINILIVLFLSFVFTILSIVIMMGLISKGYILKASYYESKVEEIQKYIKNYSDKIVNKDFKKQLDTIIPLQGVEYEVINLKGEVVYGEYKTPITSKPVKIVSNNNIENYGFLGQEVVKYVPIKYNNKLQGMIVFRYYLRASAKNPKYNFLVRSYLLSPFIYIIIFTFIFSTKLYKRLNKPLRQLRDGAQKIRNKDLEFSISYDSNNELGMVCKAFEDMRLELKNTLEKQWRMEEERKEMVSAIAHDLRTPITVIKGHVEALIDANKLDADRLDRYLKLIDNNADRMTKLISEINILTKIESIDFNINYREGDIIEFVSEKDIDYRILCEDKNIRFYLNIEDKRDNNKLVFTDIYVLSEILDNLVSNSLRFTPKEGWIKLNLSLTYEKVIFCVQDCGCGFSNKDIAHAFNRFYQGDESRSKGKGHSGLGLYIVKSLVEKLNGNIRIGNSEYGGACVEFEIPLLYKNS
ncbi:HAMP domain-containing sensor histidine kinase [Clostridium brassicae]|uniref:histidine kinase n=1 Tax=Clostridium brassicae TaxID=2999072 RepID=A0ABT4DEI9_9CLOT|nr:HAMP domain-containing sensor histidine kinase [Clostridium brassicae]MCY6960717.1 HAMP domain-containing sensor histidine kinase [Clostridium brassicae]